ncbi:hypothetical protein P2G88_13925 [Aliiglaciecola sp. CAU 1673]|uniref:hypothetical protein n=1 Tax=Aliiglaciecola sp. CAU 1673 TaxID=3032595 RepID=UPI0023D9832C|nr:hypothetical protein [Aliiglaciecola sp. CAU 1673]MDF2179352.1 hypothetical protein [Aliiglaciecola sp. CAU 1673]
MKPYKNIQTQNLGAVLFIARMLAILGYLAVGLALLIGLLSVFSTGLVGFAVAFPVLGVGMTALFMSALLAALVAIEQTLQFAKKE